MPDDKATLLSETAIAELEATPGRSFPPQGTPAYRQRILSDHRPDRAPQDLRTTTPASEKLDALLAQSSTSAHDAALFAEMLSLPDDGRYPALELTPQQRRQRTLGALVSQIVALFF